MVVEQLDEKEAEKYPAGTVKFEAGQEQGQGQERGQDLNPGIRYGTMLLIGCMTYDVFKAERIRQDPMMLLYL